MVADATISCRSLSCRESSPLSAISQSSGLQHAVNHSTPHSFKGSIDYMAPEVIATGLPGARTKYDGKAADTWSCGVILCAFVYYRFLNK